MLGFKVLRFVSRSGGELAVLLERDGCPAFWPNVFVTANYVRRGKSVNTSVKVLRSLGMAQLWAISLGRDLETELTHGSFLSVDDADLLASFLGLTAAEQEAQLVTPSGSPVKTSKISKLEAYRPHPRALSASVERSNPVETATRIRWVASYIEWHLTRRLGNLARQSQDIATLSAASKKVISRLRSLTPRAAGSKDDDMSLEGVSLEVLQTIEEAMLPGAPNNPFQGAFLQARNYLYWRLLLDTGGRRDEVRSVKVADIDYSTRRLRIRVSKTVPRTVPIVHQTAEFFDCFINEHWAHLPRESRRQGYLFTNKEGQHLSLRSCNRIFESLRKKVIDIPDFFTPHTVRRAWNDAFSESVDALPAESRPNEKAEAAMRSKLQGWSENSTMADRYAKRTIRRKADEIAETLMSGVKSKKEKA